MSEFTGLFWIECDQIGVLHTIIGGNIVTYKCEKLPIGKLVEAQ